VARTSVSRNRQGCACWVACQAIDRTPKLLSPNTPQSAGSLLMMSLPIPCSLTAPEPFTGPQQGGAASPLTTS
jgi:hypothetical protein